MHNLNKPWAFKKSTKTSEKLYIDRPFLPKEYNISARKLHWNYVPWHWWMMQKLKENWLVTWKWHNSLVNFHASSWKSEKLHFDRLLLNKVHNVWVKELQRSYMSWRMMQYLKKNWLLVRKMNKKCGSFFMRAVTSLKTCTC